MPRQLHIANGNILAQNILDLGIQGDIVVWREMLCEGPTTYELGTPEFIKMRTAFLKKGYQINPEDYKEKFLDELHKLDRIKNVDEIILWFEFDLFSHINMIAAISRLIENKIDLPVYLVCSKKLKGEKEFQPLSQLSLKHLKNHFDQKIPLNEDDLEMANVIWQYYNEENPLKLKALIKQKSNFEYLSSCVRTHIERFPNSKTGLNTIEANILRLIKENNITSLNQLLGYSIQYQGYFGYGERQIQRLLDKLKPFYSLKNNKIVLTAKGEEAHTAARNFYQDLKNKDSFGGVKMYDFLYDSESHNILKL
ncbi:uncharacterized protein DUF1835 [Gillisia sp. Hel_I_86]|uniref:DUF1835 domain-containing protein n=1 Tax=Gillisia sp. Hel_I_86 TaxID=1249981 RepID=UPI00119B8BBE|nr:DUF1835 domain-containing protein [Gillisia sp. Hel_I_86]TVZ28266.1 uncharacterized protein DUF1835 [Gillisia sp. Hel_I_86]